MFKREFDIKVNNRKSRAERYNGRVRRQEETLT
jgi:hypothetical protein